MGETTNEVKSSLTVFSVFFFVVSVGANEETEEIDNATDEATQLDQRSRSRGSRGGSCTPLPIFQCTLNELVLYILYTVAYYTHI